MKLITYSQAELHTHTHTHTLCLHIEDFLTSRTEVKTALNGFQSPLSVCSKSQLKTKGDVILDFPFIFQFTSIKGVTKQKKTKNKKK